MKIPFAYAKRYLISSYYQLDNSSLLHHESLLRPCISNLALASIPVDHFVIRSCAPHTGTESDDAV